MVQAGKGRLKTKSSRKAHDATLTAGKKKRVAKKNVATGAGTAYARQPNSGIKRRKK